MRSVGVKINDTARGANGAINVINVQEVIVCPSDHRVPVRTSFDFELVKNCIRGLWERQNPFFAIFL